ncbi:MAG: UDP-3-O-(3-hydroxymyristoyl)glucosamine N-acyltransferase [Thiotrichales bacterium]|nr:MAG: UDP-3-O-(3-hydroxymyristoyl)glucosamine N-acyltransferase [Thiotrichales bacterium]
MQIKTQHHSKHITRIQPLDRASDTDISFLSNSKYKEALQTTKAIAVLIKQDDLADCKTNAIIVEDPYLAFAQVAKLFAPDIDFAVSNEHTISKSASIGAGSYIGKNVVIEDNVVIGPNCVLMDNVTIASGSFLYANVTLYQDVKIGKKCILHSGSVIGSDGFGMAHDPQGKWVKIPQLGSVKISDNVEIGANTCVDRGALVDTEIHQGVKIDNQVQVAHNVIIKENTVIAAQVGIAGSTVIGKNCMVGGASAINGHITICDNTIITGMSMVTKSINIAGVYSSGIPARPQKVWRRNTARVQNIDGMAKRLASLEKRYSEKFNNLTDKN